MEDGAASKVSAHRGDLSLNMHEFTAFYNKLVNFEEIDRFFTEYDYYSSAYYST